MTKSCEKNTSLDEMQVKYEEMKKFVIELTDQARHYTFTQVNAQGCQTDRAIVLSGIAIIISIIEFFMILFLRF